MDINGFILHGDHHRELLGKFEQVNSLLHQLTDGAYHCLEVCMTNCNHLRELVNHAMAMLHNPDFEEYLIRNDAALYYNLQSVMLAVRMVKNMMENLAGTMRQSVLETTQRGQLRKVG